MVNTERAIEAVVGLLSYEGDGVDRTQPISEWGRQSGVVYMDAAGEPKRLDRYDIYGGYVGDKARQASVIVQPSIRSVQYVEESLYPHKVSESYTIAINVVSRSFAKNQQEQLIAVCDTIQQLIEGRPDFIIGSAHDMPRPRIVAVGEVWEQEETRGGDAGIWMALKESVADEAFTFGLSNAIRLEGENYIRVSSVDYNDEIQFGVRRAEAVSTIYVTITTNSHIGLV